MQNAKTSKLNGASVDSLLLAFIQLVTYASNIGASKLIAVSLSLEQVGVYSATMTVLTLAASFTLFGLGDCTNYFFNNKKNGVTQEDRLSYVNTIYLIQLLLGIVVGLVLVVFRGAIGAYYRHPAMKALMVIVCLKPWLENAVHLYQVLFVSCQRAKLISIRNLIIAIARVVIVFFALYINQNLLLVFILLVALDVLQLVTLKVIFGKTEFFVNIFKSDINKIRPIVNYGVPMGIFAVTNTLMREVDKLVVGGLATTDNLAIYSNCAKQLPLTIIVSAFATVLLPYIMKYVSEKDSENATKLFRNYLQLGYLSIWMFSFALMISVKQVIPFLYSDEYLPGQAIFILYLVEGMLRFASMHLIIAANGESKYLMKASIILLAANAALNYAFYYLFEVFGNPLLGPAVSTVSLTCVYCYLILKKSATIINKKLTELLDCRFMAKYVGMLSVLAAAFFFAKEMAITAGLNRFIAMLLCCILYCVAACALNFKKYRQILGEINQFKLS